MVKQRVCQRAAHAFVEQRTSRPPATLIGEPVAVPFPILARADRGLFICQVIAQLGQGIGIGGEVKCSPYRFVDLHRPPTAE